jgi:hypothetical protein
MDKQLLYCSSHYTTWSRIDNIWHFWDTPVILYDDKLIVGKEYIYYLKEHKVGESAYLQDSKLYKGEPDGIFANEHRPEFVLYGSNIHKYMEWLDNNDAYYLAFGSFVDNMPNYILK